MATGCIVDNSHLIKKVAFPRLTIPVATVLFNFAQYLLTFLVFLAAMFLFFHIAPSWTMLLFVPFLGLQVLFTIGLGLLLATGTAFFRDIRHFVEILLLLLFWLTPIIYEYARLPASLQTIILLSPLSPFILAYHQVFYYAELPAVALWLQASFYAVVALGIGYTVFHHYAPRLAEEV
jgi:ABC-type polysaccharide/polyol phosphate export permease